MGSPFSGPRCVTILLPGGVSLTPGGVWALLRCAQRRCGAPPWAGAAADVFRGPGATLLIVRESPPPVRAQLAPYAIPFIHKYFKD